MARTANRPFRSDDRGSFAMLFGLTASVLLTLSGLGLDYGRVMLARRVLVEAADATALAVGRALMNGNLTQADADQLGQAYFAENAKALARVKAAIPTPTITADFTTHRVTVSAVVTVPMTLMRIAGFNTVRVPASAVSAFDAKDLEVAMALDITGSMAGVPNGGGTTKSAGLKAAFRSFAETIIPSNPQVARQVRIGIAPFSAAVNLGPYAAAATGNRSADGCVTERANGSQTDRAPSTGGLFFTAADGRANIDPTEGGVGQNLYGCPTPSIVPLTSDRTLLINKVNAFTPGGRTAGHIGTQWAWNLISEDYAGFWGATAAPAAYADTQGADPRLIKAVILMTDGIFNTAYHNDIARNQALALCTAMKARGVVVFTIGFGLGNTGVEAIAKQTLRDCATPGAKFFADASNATQLDAALQSFAAVLTQLRITS